MTADLHPDTGLPRPGTCCGVCPPIAGGGWDCTCPGLPDCPAAARAEAERHYPALNADDEALTYPRSAVREHARGGFVKGYEAGWAAALAAGRAETTTATTEDAARVIDDACYGGASSPQEIAQALADAGLLATARTRPTREAIEEAIEAGKVAHDDAVAAGGAVGPQNDYIAEEVDALLNHDQPTEAEAGARALVHAAGDHFHAMVAAGAGNPSEVSTWLRERAARLRGGAR